MPYDVEDWLPENHLARFIVEIVSMLNFKHIYKQYKGVGSTATTLAPSSANIIV